MVDRAIEEAAVAVEALETMATLRARIATLEAENARLKREVETQSKLYRQALKRAKRTEASAAVKGWTVGAHESDGQTWLTIKMPNGPVAMLSCRSRIDCGDETIVSQIVKEFASALSR